jgi:predicted nucleic acid-binding protein
LKIVISDTSPINYLVLIGKQDILPALFDRIIVPQSVVRELSAAAAPHSVRRWIAAPPSWLEIREPAKSPGPELFLLGDGERDAIQLAEELKADLLVMDERAGREEALKRGLPVIGTLGIVEQAAERGLLDFAVMLADLKAHNFFISSALEDDFLARDAQRKSKADS